MKVAVCDDDYKICDIIEDVLDEYGKRIGIFIEVFQFYSVEKLVEKIEDGEKFNLIFQDIEFPNMSGIEFGKYLRDLKDDVYTDIVFVSGSNSYDRELFSFQPLYFISKPFEKSDVIKALELSINRMEKRNTHFVYKKGSATVRVPLQDILYFQSDNREVIIYTIDNKDQFYGKLSDLEKDLADSFFLRVHKSFIVNSNFISVIEKSSVVLKKDVLIPLGKMYGDSLLKFLENNMSGEWFGIWNFN